MIRFRWMRSLCSQIGITNKEITKYLHFSEQEYVVWYQKEFQVLPIEYQRPSPLFFYDLDQEIRLTVDTWAGEVPGNIAVTFRDNEEVELVSFGASQKYKGAHEVLLRHKQHQGGIVGVKISTPGSKEIKYYELEFRDRVKNGNGALIESQAVGGGPLPSPEPLPMVPFPVTLQPGGLEILTEPYNAKVKKEKPWESFLITEEMIKASIREKIEGVAEEWQPTFRVILEGKIPKDASLDYFSNAECSAFQRMRYFFPRLSVRNGNQGYTLAVGQDVKEDCP